MGWLPLTRHVQAFTLYAGETFVACAPVIAVPTVQIAGGNNEAELYALGERLASAPGTHSAANEDEGMRFKLDAAKFLPGMDRAIAEAAKEKIVLASVCKNAASTIPVLRASMTELGLRFKDYRVIMYESRSSDNTAAAIQAWADTDAKVWC